MAIQEAEKHFSLKLANCLTTESNLYSWDRCGVAGRLWTKGDLPSETSRVLRARFQMSCGSGCYFLFFGGWGRSILCESYDVGPVQGGIGKRVLAI